MMLIINIKLNYLMVICQFMSISLRAIEMISRTNEIRNKSVVVLTENSHHNRITSMSCLKKVINTVETECSKSFTNVLLWRDGMRTQFRSRFIFQPLAGTMFLNKSLCCYYNEGNYGKFPMDDEGEIIKNVIFRKKSKARLWSINTKNFLMLP